MKLLQCSIENFGTLSGFQRTFDAGLSVLLENNGFGKTTLAAFIKAMFYGLPASTKRSLDENERKRYTPWQGGVFGGSLDFEIDGKQYRIERRFEAKEKDDTFTLIDLRTGQVSRDYTANIGTELFGLDADSFARSTYLPQRGAGAGMTTGISAKLTDMVENNGDMNNYDTAQRTLEEHRRFYGLLRGTGGETARLSQEQGELNRRLEQQREELDKLQKIREAGEKYKAMLPAVEEELAGLRRRKEEAVEQRVTREVEARRAQLQQAVQAAEAKEKRYVTLFSHGIPKEEELEECRERAETDAALRRQIEAMENDGQPEQQLEEARRFFKGFIPTQAEVERISGYVSQYEEMELIVRRSVLSEEETARKEALHRRFEEHPLTREDISAARRGLMEYDFIAREKVGAQENLRTLQNQTVPEAHVPVALWLLAALGFVAGAALLILHSYVPGGVWLGAAALVLGVVFTVTAVVVGKNRAAAAASAAQALQSRIAAREQELAERTAAAEEAARSISAVTAPFGLQEVNEKTEPLLQQLDEELALLRHLEETEARHARVRAQCLAQMKEPKTHLNIFFGRYFPLQQIRYSDALREVTQRLDLLENRVSAKEAWENKLAALRQQQEAAAADVTAFLERYGLPKVGRPGEAVTRIRDSVREATLTHEAAESARAVLQAFLQEHPLPQGEVDVQSEEAPADTDEQEQACNAKRDELLRRISACDSETARLDDAMAALEETEEALSVCTAKLEESRRNFDTLTHTIDSLDKARTNLNVRYKDVIAQRFNEYMKQVDAAFGDVSLDANLRVSSRQYGAARPSEAFSEGYRALVDICLRLALIDALYPEEKPFLILDDPFATLDAEKIRGSLRVLYDLAKGRQIIYLVCHESRT